MQNKFKICLNTYKYLLFLRPGGEGTELALERAVACGQQQAVARLVPEQPLDIIHLETGQPRGFFRGLFHQSNPPLFQDSQRVPERTLNSTSAPLEGFKFSLQIKFYGVL